MLRPEIIETLFDIIDETTTLISFEQQSGYLSAMCESCRNIMAQKIGQSLTVQTEADLQKLYKKLEELELKQEEIRKALQLAILKGLKAEGLTNATMTPDSIALIVGYLATKFLKDFKHKKIADLAVGTGNFLTAVLNQINTRPEAVYGVDLNYDLLQIAYVLSDMQEHEVQFYHQSSLKPLLIDPLDAIICDLPVAHLEKRELNELDLTLVNKGCNYLPYLLIENHLSYLKPGGYAIYVIPNNLFVQSHSGEFHQMLIAQANIQALLQLPASLFKADQLGKSLFIIQKHGDQVQPVQEVLVAQLPNLSDPTKFGQTIKRIESWIKSNK